MDNKNKTNENTEDTLYDTKFDPEDQYSTISIVKDIANKLNLNA